MNLTEPQEIKSFVTDFFMYYYTERNYEKVMDCMAPNILFVGLVNDEIVHSRDACRSIVQSQMKSVSKPIPYFVNDYYQMDFGGGHWNCYALIDLNVVSTELGTSQYHIRISLSVRKTADRCEITAVHISETDNLRNDKSRFGRTSEPAKTTAQIELGRIISQVVPGGIASRYVGVGSPVSIVNNEYLRMLGHATFYDYMVDCGGLFENGIHPDDMEKFLYNVKYIMTSGKQAECEYRIRRGDGSYIWVHDTGRKATSTDGKDLIVSILTDMSDQIELQKRLEKQTETDELTSVYNRRGAIKHFKNWDKPYSCYAFFVIDVDNFKLINDLYGHKQGDRMLIRLATLLSEHFNADGIVCRLGGDEFSVFLPNFGDIEKLKLTLEEIVRIFKADADMLCPDANSSLSVGGVYGHAPLEVELTFDTADANLYQIKRSSKNGICVTELN